MIKDVEGMKNKLSGYYDTDKWEFLCRIIDSFNVEEPLTVRSIVADNIDVSLFTGHIRVWLEDHEYDGLFREDGNDTCGCNLDDFCPCGTPQPDCRPAYRHKDGCMYLEEEKEPQ